MLELEDVAGDILGGEGTFVRPHREDGRWAGIDLYVALSDGLGELTLRWASHDRPGVGIVGASVWSSPARARMRIVPAPAPEDTPPDDWVDGVPIESVMLARGALVRSDFAGARATLQPPQTRPRELDPAASWARLEALRAAMSVLRGPRRDIAPLPSQKLLREARVKAFDGGAVGRASVLIAASSIEEVAEAQQLREPSSPTRDWWLCELMQLLQQLQYDHWSELGGVLARASHARDRVRRLRRTRSARSDEAGDVDKGRPQQLVSLCEALVDDAIRAAHTRQRHRV